LEEGGTEASACNTWWRRKDKKRASKSHDEADTRTVARCRREA